MSALQFTNKTEAKAFLESVAVNAMAPARTKVPTAARGRSGLSTAVVAVNEEFDSVGL